jgi:hypothetical protein
MNNPVRADNFHIFPMTNNLIIDFQFLSHSVFQFLSPFSGSLRGQGKNYLSA